jgi:hypothetical protein
MGYASTSDMAGIGSAGNPFARRFGDAFHNSARLLDGIRVHHRPSTCARAASAWGSQKVISMLRYNSMAVMSAVWACCR